MSDPQSNMSFSSKASRRTRGSNPRSRKPPTTFLGYILRLMQRTGGRLTSLYGTTKNYAWVLSARKFYYLIFLSSWSICFDAIYVGNSKRTNFENAGNA